MQSGAAHDAPPFDTREGMVEPHPSRHPLGPPPPRTGDSAAGLVGKDGAPAPPNRTHRQAGLPNRSPSDTRACGPCLRWRRQQRDRELPWNSPSGCAAGQARVRAYRAGRSGWVWSSVVVVMTGEFPAPAGVYKECRAARWAAQRVGVVPGAAPPRSAPGNHPVSYPVPFSARHPAFTAVGLDRWNRHTLLPLTIPAMTGTCHEPSTSSLTGP